MSEGGRAFVSLSLNAQRLEADAGVAAQESIYILDWWLSPELYLRRPPSANERYRLDNLLKTAADRGVSVKIIVYKEVQAALTCKLPCHINTPRAICGIHHCSRQGHRIQ